MRNVIAWVKDRIPLRYWAWAHAFIVLGFGWGHAIALFPPTSYEGVIDFTLVFRMGVLTALGSLIAVVGMFMTRAKVQKNAHRGLWIELVGTILLAGGPLQYWSIQTAFVIEGAFDQRYALGWFAYSMCAFMVVRFAILIPALIEASRQARMVKRSLL